MNRPGLLHAARWLLIGLFLGGPVLGVVLAPETAKIDALWLTSFTMAFTYGIVGMVITGHRPRNPVGWVFLGAGAVYGFFVLAAAQSEPRAQTGESALTMANAVDVLGNVSTIPYLLLCTTFTILLYPEGLPSRRWRPVLWAAVLATFAMVCGAAVSPLLLDTGSGQLPNPLNPDGAGVWTDRLFGVGGAVIAACTFAGLISAAFRTWRSTGVQRAQMRWYASAVTLVVLVYVALLAVPDLEGSLLGGLALFAALTYVPVSCGVAIMRYRLYEIDRIISRTLSYALVTGVLLAVYAAVVTSVTQLLPGTSSSFSVAAATLVAATMFRPLLTRVQRLVDHRFNRSSYDAHQTVESFASRLRDEVSTEQVTADLVAALEDTLQPAKHYVWLRESGR